MKAHLKTVITEDMVFAGPNLVDCPPAGRRGAFPCLV
jgi:hypothetical protein